MSGFQAPEGYALGKCLHANSVSSAYAAVRERDGHGVVLKRYLEDAMDDGESRAQREFAALRAVAGPGIVAALELVGTEDAPVLVLEPASGMVLDSWVQAGLPGIAAVLEIAIQLSDALARVHDARLLHRDITPHNVFVDPTGLQACLIDFGLARPLGSAAVLSEAGSKGRSLAGSLRYISPEQTGRMDRGVDSRSDLYGLGGTLYFTLTGRPPFDLTDPLGLIHAHLAKVPTPPIELRPEVPATLSHIVAKLLQKAPEARYQTARALHRDLVECRTQLRDRGRIDDDFPLGSADAPYRPLFSRKLHGREDEVQRLLGAYARAVGGGATALFLEGPPGIGKSALVQELRGALVESRGYLASGKFDLYRRDVPYLGFVQAFESLIQQILTESDARLEQWRTSLHAALGPSAGVRVELVPDLAIVLGEVEPVPRLGPAATRARLSLAVHRFFQGLATREHPLVLFLDDLQWADEASRSLIQDLLGRDPTRALLLLCAYRDGESEARPAVQLRGELRARGVDVEELALAPISNEACARMLAGALGRSLEQTRSLAACVARKTGNAPLLIQQFVYHMYDLRLIRFEPGVGWSWDDAALAAAEIPEDAVGLMTAKIGRLEAEVAAVLQLASCVGDTFELDTLVELTARPRSALEAALFTLCDEGLIAPAPEGFRFVHDRVREAAQAGLSDAERAQVHHEAARLLLERTPPEALLARAAEIADHLNFAHERLDDAERIRAIELDVAAGARGLRAGAAATAAHYVAAGRALFREVDWETHAELGFRLFIESAESAYQMREIALALELLAKLETRSWPRMHSAQIAAKHITVRTLDDSGQELDLVLATLRRFGVRWPAYPSRLRTRLEILRADWALRGPLDERALRPLGAGDHSDWMAPLVIMGAGASALTRKTVRLVCLLTGFSMRRARRHGYLIPPGLPLAGYAAFRLGFLRHLRGAERYAQAALDWNERVNDPVVRPRSELVVYAFVYSWIRPRRTILEPLRRVENQCWESGDVEYAFYACQHRAHQASLAGEPLAALRADYAAIAATGAFARQWPNIQPRIFALLEQPLPDAAALGREIAEIEQVLAGTDAARMAQWVFWLEVLCLLGLHDAAFATSEQIAEWISDVGATCSQAVDFTFLRGVLAAERAARATGSARRRHARVLRQCLRRVRIWAEHGPDFVHMVDALRAERARLGGRAAQALAAYASATDRATRQGYRHHAAFLLERRARLLGELRRDTEASTALRQAVKLYAEWGAHGKAEALRTTAE